MILLQNAMIAPALVMATRLFERHEIRYAWFCNSFSEEASWRCRVSLGTVAPNYPAK